MFVGDIEEVGIFQLLPFESQSALQLPQSDKPMLTAGPTVHAVVEKGSKYVLLVTMALRFSCRIQFDVHLPAGFIGCLLCMEVFWHRIRSPTSVSWLLYHLCCAIRYTPSLRGLTVFICAVYTMPVTIIRRIVSLLDIDVG